MAFGLVFLTYNHLPRWDMKHDAKDLSVSLFMKSPAPSVVPSIWKILKNLRG